MTLSEMLPFGLGPEDVIIVLAAIAVVAVSLAIFSGLTKDQLASRIRLVSRANLSSNDANPVSQVRQTKSLAEMVTPVVERLKLMRGKQAEKYAVRLSRAGYRSKDALVIYLFSKLVLPAVFGAVAVVAFYLAPVVELAPMGSIIAVLIAVLIGSYAPEFVVRSATKKRRNKIRKALPDAFDLLVICTEAGLSLDASLKRVTREIKGVSKELADEFDLTSFELGFLPDRKQAFQNLGRRIDLNEVQSLTATLEQTERFGTPLAQALRVLAAELRNERLLRAEEKAARLPATMTVPLIVFILPSLVIVVIGPALLDVFDALSNM